jgi:hypothetical protein
MVRVRVRVSYEIFGHLLHHSRMTPFRVKVWVRVRVRFRVRGLV